MTATDKPRHILVVEDDPYIRESIVEVLEDEGYVVDFAGDGLQALTALQDGRVPDLILLDLMMPRMNGYQFREEQLKGAHAHVPVALITAGGNEKEKSERLKAAGYLRKPVRLQPLLEFVERVLAAA